MRKINTPIMKIITSIIKDTSNTKGYKSITVGYKKSEPKPAKFAISVSINLVRIQLQERNTQFLHHFLHNQLNH